MVEREEKKWEKKENIIQRGEEGEKKGKDNSEKEQMMLVERDEGW